MNQPLTQSTVPHQHPPAVTEPAWLHGHPHEPNPAPPSPDATFIVRIASAIERPSSFQTQWSVADLYALPATTVSDCYIVSTGHGTSGPFTFAGVRLLDFIEHLGIPNWQQVDLISADGFGTRLAKDELAQDPPHHPSLLVYQRNGQPLRREEGLVRLIVPTEKDDALKQVKWVAEIVVYG